MPDPTDTPVEAPTRKGSIDARLANLRPATDLAKTCSQCAHYEPGWNGCAMVAADRIRPDYVCDLFIATTLEAEAADDDEHGYAMKGSAALGITKADDAEQNVFGWAYVSKRADGEQVTDHSGEQVAPADLEAAAYEFVVESRKAGDRHQGDAVGVMVESMVFTPEKLAKMGLPADALPTGWWVGFHLPDAADYELVKSGDRAMFSIEGTAIREPVVEKAIQGSAEDHSQKLRESLQELEPGARYVWVRATFNDRVVYEMSTENAMGGMDEHCYERDYTVSGDSFMFGPARPVEIEEVVTGGSD